MVAAVLQAIADAAGVGCEVRVEERDGAIHAEYVGGEAAALIGHHGQTLDSIQHLAQRVAFKGVSASVEVVVDAGGYRGRRTTALCAMADQAADAAVRDGRAVALEPMGAGERKVVHMHLKERRDVETFSEGEEPSRRLIVAPVAG